MDWGWGWDELGVGWDGLGLQRTSDWMHLTCICWFGLLLCWRGSKLSRFGPVWEITVNENSKTDPNRFLPINSDWLCPRGMLGPCGARFGWYQNCKIFWFFFAVLGHIMWKSFKGAQIRTSELHNIEEGWLENLKKKWGPPRKVGTYCFF